MNKRSVLLSFLLFIAGFQIQAQKQTKISFFVSDPAEQPAEITIDVDHAKLDISKIDPYAHSLIGKVTYTFRPLRTNTDSIIFTGPKLNSCSVKINGVDAKVRFSGGLLKIYPSQKLTYLSTCNMMIDYAAYDLSGLLFMGFDDTSNTKKKQCWGIGLESFAPGQGSKWDLMTHETIIRFDKNFKVLSNGDRLLVKDNKDGTMTWHYSLNYPDQSCLVCLIIGNYEYKSMKTARGMPLEYWYCPDQASYFDIGYKYSVEMFSWLENEFGMLYPWGIYKQAPVQDCPFGGMETTTSTIFNENLFADARVSLDRNYINVNVHELIHQWFGNYVLYPSSHDIWVSESFATYYAKMFEKHIFGEDRYQYLKLLEYNRVMDAALKDDFPVGTSWGGTQRWYPKGSLVLDMLRYVLGEDNFRTAITYELKTNPFTVVNTPDILKAIRESTGLCPDWFFDEWINHGGEPNYKISMKEYTKMDGTRETHVTTEQVQDQTIQTGLFKMPVIYEVFYTDNTYDSVKVMVEKQITEVVIPNKGKKTVAFVLFDPGRHILKKVSYPRSFKELSAQLLQAPQMIDRYDALTEMKTMPDSVKREVLIKAFEKEKYFMVKAEVIAQLVYDKNPLTIELFRKAINDPDADVRRSVAYNLKQIPSLIEKDYIKLLKDSSYMIIAEALKNLSSSFPENAKIYIGITAKETGFPGRNILIQRLEIASDLLKDQSALKELVEYSSITRYEATTCINAMNSLKRLNYMDAVFASNLIQSLLYWDSKCSDAASDVVKYFMQQNAPGRMLRSEYLKRTDTEKEKLKMFFQ